jgi:hypothetical protein
MIKRIWNEEREYYNTDTGLIKSQKGYKEFRMFGIRISRRETNFDSQVTDKKSGLGFKS